MDWILLTFDMRRLSHNVWQQLPGNLSQQIAMSSSIVANSLLESLPDIRRNAVRDTITIGLNDMWILSTGVAFLGSTASFAMMDVMDVMD